MRTSVSETADLPRERLFAWWTDYAPDDHASGLFRKALVGGWDEREILQKTEDRVSYVERGKWLGLAFTEHVEARLTPPHRVDFTSQSRFGRLTGTFFFEALPGGGARVTYLIDVPPGQGLGRIPAPLLAPAARWAMGLDLAWHLEEAARDLKG